MHDTKHLALLITLASTSLAPVGCSSAPPSEPAPASKGDLALDVATSAHVAGHLSSGAASIAFDITNEAGTKHIVIASARGPLVESTIAPARTHRTLLLGGRLVVEGSSSSPPTFTGDRGAAHDLEAMPEGELVSRLEASLADAGIGAALLPNLAPPEGEADQELRVDSWSDYPCGSWVYPGQSVVCGTTFFGSTTIVMFNCSAPVGGAKTWANGSSGVDWFVPGDPHPGQCGAVNISGWYWGSNVTMEDIGQTTLQLTH